MVGTTQASLGNQTLSITASSEEHQQYVRLVTAQPRLARHYVRHFGDIYLTNAALLPEFDVVTMFHLCEFYHSETSSVAYGGMTDRQLLDLFTRRTRPGGHMLFYRQSLAFEATWPLLRDSERHGKTTRVHDYKSLVVYRTW